MYNVVHIQLILLLLAIDVLCFALCIGRDKEEPNVIEDRHGHPVSNRVRPDSKLS